MKDSYRLVPVDYDEYAMNQKSKLPYRKIINEFLDSDVDVVEVQFDDGIKRDTVCTAFYSAVKKSGAPVKVSMRKGKIYLIKKQED